MSKKKQPIQCSTCFYGKRSGFDFNTTECRRNPVHHRFNHDHWCGEYLDEATGKDLVQRPE